MSASIEVTHYEDDDTLVVNAFDVAGGSASMGVSRREALVLSSMLRSLANDPGPGAKITWEAEPVREEES